MPRRLLVGVALLGFLSLAASPAAGHHIAGATYTGSGAAGGTVEFAVSGDGTSITRFEVTAPPGSGCSLPQFEQRYPDGLAISNHSFNDPTASFQVRGEFNGVQAASGSVTIGGDAPASCHGTSAWTANTPTSGQATVAVPLRAKVSAVVSKGLAASVACPWGCSVVAELVASSSTAKKVGLSAASVVVGRGTATRSQAGTVTVRVKLKSKAKRKLRRLKRIKLKLRTKITDANGGTRTVNKNVTLQRSLPPNRAPRFPSPMRTNSRTDFFYDSSGRLSGATTTLTILSAPSDPDGDPLTYSWVATNGSITGNGLSATWDRQVSFGQPAPGDATITARDGRGESDTFTFEFR